MWLRQFIPAGISKHYKQNSTLFKKETEYALRGLVYIQLQNLRGRRPGIAEIAREIDAPYHYTGKIFQRLARHGFVESAKGKGGGFYFDADRPELPLKTIISAIEGDSLFTGCGIGLKACDNDNPCPIHHEFAPIRDAINSLVSGETIQNLAGKIAAGENTLLARLK